MLASQDAILVCFLFFFLMPQFFSRSCFGRNPEDFKDDRVWFFQTFGQNGYLVDLLLIHWVARFFVIFG